ncbi:glycosyl hydrolase family 28-related protein [Paenibacillus sp. GYB003]|uniref:glycosyl hydrolase family 28-related protein n=1 Tax=Paenibacillus sp. GYB003 TaxID=2994392 RepID=UPI002F962C37
MKDHQGKEAEHSLRQHPLVTNHMDGSYAAGESCTRDAAAVKTSHSAIDRKVSRRKMLAALGLSTVALASGGLVSRSEALSGKRSVTGATYGGGVDPVPDADQVPYRYAAGQPQHTVGDKLREFVSVMDFGAVGDGVADDTQAIQTAISSFNDMPGIVHFPNPGAEYVVTAPLQIGKGLTFAGESRIATRIKYTGPAGTGLFESRSDDWPFEVVFERLHLIGNGVDGNGNVSRNGTNHGIYIGDEASTQLINNPWVRIRDCRLEGFKRAIYLEGYGHSIDDTYIRLCDTGIALVHPEQTSAMNSWVEYCNIGVDINPDYKYNKAGHRLTWIGGAIQRNNIGLIARNFYDLRIQTYCELNVTNDIVLGVADAGGYKKGVFGAIVDMNSASNVTDAHIKLEHAQDIECQVSFFGTMSSVPHIKADGYSKYIAITYDAEKIRSSNPWSFSGYSVRSTLIKTKHNKQEYLSWLAFENIFKDNGTEFARFKTNYVQTRLALEFELKQANFNISSNSSSAGFNLYDKRTDLTKWAYCYPGGNFTMTQSDFETEAAGKGLIVKSPNGTKYRIGVDDNGAITATQLIF